MLEKQIKEKLIENNLIKSSNDVHIEKFTYDLNQYFVNNLVVEKDFYVCFYNNSNKILMDAGKYLKN